jgi:hypothetical protein
MKGIVVVNVSPHVKCDTGSLMREMARDVEGWHLQVLIFSYRIICDIASLFDGDADGSSCASARTSPTIEIGFRRLPRPSGSGWDNLTSRSMVWA